MATLPGSSCLDTDIHLFKAKFFPKVSAYLQAAENETPKTAGLFAKLSAIMSQDKVSLEAKAAMNEMYVALCGVNFHKDDGSKPSKTITGLEVDKLYALSGVSTFGELLFVVVKTYHSGGIGRRTILNNGLMDMLKESGLNDSYMRLGLDNICNALTYSKEPEILPPVICDLKGMKAAEITNNFMTQLNIGLDRVGIERPRLASLASSVSTLPSS